MKCVGAGGAWAIGTMSNSMIMLVSKGTTHTYKCITSITHSGLFVQAQAPTKCPMKAHIPYAMSPRQKSMLLANPKSTADMQRVPNMAQQVMLVGALCSPISACWAGDRRFGCWCAGVVPNTNWHTACHACCPVVSRYTGQTLSRIWARLVAGSTAYSNSQPHC
jgi:hypothetical protein